ncbi:sensor histidine kinase [Corynebacterium sp. 11A]|uniref:sensor histidine kinase n=1 Tax=Corynebacterium sp. 11A TaxID=2080510 RepID=UPI00124D3C17|nr:sensor histidine kinase [Corynebacterium sp. 11A]
MSVQLTPAKHPFGARSSSPAAILVVGETITAGILVIVGALGALREASPLLILPAVIAFCAAFVLLHRPRLRLGVLLLLWAGLVCLSFSFTWVAFVLFLLAGHYLRFPLLPVYALLVLAGVWGATWADKDQVGVPQLLGPAIGAVVAIGMSRGYVELLRILNDLERAHSEMAYLQDELAATQREAGAMDERTRISQDIHDTIAQGLSSIRLLAQPSHPTPAAEKLVLIEEVATENLAEVRRIVADLAPHGLESTPLAVALQTMVDGLAAGSGIDAELEVHSAVRFSDPIDIALLRVAQSALANVRLHAAASRVRVSLDSDEEQVRMDIVDDGVGFDVAAWEHSRATTSFGLSFMRSRLQKLGGGLDIESTPGEGTAISAWVPL